MLSPSPSPGTLREPLLGLLIALGTIKIGSETAHLLRVCMGPTMAFLSHPTPRRVSEIAGGQFFLGDIGLEKDRRRPSRYMGENEKNYQRCSFLLHVVRVSMENDSVATLCAHIGLSSRLMRYKSHSAY